MMHSFLVFGQAGGPDMDSLRRVSKPGVFSSPELMILLISALGLSALLFVWAFFIRKRPKAARGSLVVERVRQGQSSDTSHRRRRKRKAEHPDNWGRNPTLGETGGLPPLRPESEDGDGSNASAGSEDGPQAVRPR